MTPLVTVFVAKGCGACHAYAPLIKQTGRSYPGVRVQFVEITTSHGGAFANRIGIRATPTTIVHTARRTVLRRVGALDPAGVRQLFELAVR